MKRGWHRKHTLRHLKGARRRSFNFRRWWDYLDYNIKGVLLMLVVGIAYVSLRENQFSIGIWFEEFISWWGSLELLFGFGALYGYGFVFSVLIHFWYITILNYFLIVSLVKILFGR